MPPENEEKYVYVMKYKQKQNYYFEIRRIKDILTQLFFHEYSILEKAIGRIEQFLFAYEKGPQILLGLNLG